MEPIIIDNPTYGSPEPKEIIINGQPYIPAPQGAAEGKRIIIK
jgi:hypothetical protein